MRIAASYPGFAGPQLDLLDAGCGNGATMLALAGLFRTCHGVDVSPDYVECLRREAAAISTGASRGSDGADQVVKAAARSGRLRIETFRVDIVVLQAGE